MVRRCSSSRAAVTRHGHSELLTVHDTTFGTRARHAQSQINDQVKGSQTVDSMRKGQTRNNHRQSGKMMTI
jgi:hypothetical protein